MLAQQRSHALSPPWQEIIRIGPGHRGKSARGHFTQFAFDRGAPPDEATPDGNNSLYCFNFLTQRGRRRLGAFRSMTLA